MTHEWAALGAGAVAGGYAGARTLWYAVQNPDCSWLVRSIVRGTTSRPAIALTFDDGPSESTPELLAVLDEHHVRASFFHCGANARRLPRVARAVAAAAHEIGNHSYSHARLCFKSPRFMRRELAETQGIIEELTGQRAMFFRPPYGLRWFGLAGVQEELRLTSVLWTTVGCDWKWPAQHVVDRVLQGACNGAIICLHDGRRLNPRPDISSTLDAVRQLIPRLRERGFHFETVGQVVGPTLRG